MSKLEKVHHTRRGSGAPGALNSAASRNSRMVRKSPAARSIGRLGAGGRGAPGRPEELAVRLGEAHGTARRRARAAARRPPRPPAGSGRAARAARAAPGASDSMPSTGMPSATFSSSPERLGNSCTISRARWRTAGGEQQLATRRELHALDRLGQRPLVGDRERPELLDLVAEELDAHGVVGRGREHVEDAAAHRELATAGDHVDAGVGEVDELDGDARRGRNRALRRRARSARARRGCRRAAAAPRAPRRRRRADAASRPPPSRACGAGRGARGRRSRREGLSRSCGSVSHAGNSRISASSRYGAMDARTDSPSRLVAVTTRSAGGSPASARRCEQAGEQRRVDAGGRREVGVPQGLGERAVDRGGARERRVQALQDHPTSLRAASDATASVRCRANGRRRRRPIRWAPHQTDPEGHP